MKHDVLAPTVGESVTEVSILKWAKNDGDVVRVGDLLMEIESDKATVEIVAEHEGKLKVLKPAGERIPIGAVVGSIDDSVKAGAAASAPSKSSAAPAPAASMGTSPGAHAAVATDRAAAPSVRKMVAENNLNANDIAGTGKRGMLTKGDVIQHMENGGRSGTGATAAAAPMTARAPTPAPARQLQDRPGDRRVPMSMLRAKIAERLVQAQRNAAILTTFNEADMTAIMDLRAKHKDAFKAKYGVSMGFMGFFVKACYEALKQIPEVNASIDGNDVVYHDYYDIGVAVGTERGLVVPVVRGVDKLNVPGVETAIAELAKKARDGKLSINDMNGGTFTISNGGVYGSLMSTPILNPPQSGILGMHKIQERPMVVNGKVEVRPMMYLALSYDHRLIDGKGAVTFLVTVKELLENPQKLGLEFLNGL